MCTTEKNKTSVSTYFLKKLFTNFYTKHYASCSHNLYSSFLIISYHIIHIPLLHTIALSYILSDSHSKKIGSAAAGKRKSVRISRRVGQDIKKNEMSATSPFVCWFVGCRWKKKTATSFSSSFFFLQFLFKEQPTYLLFFFGLPSSCTKKREQKKIEKKETFSFGTSLIHVVLVWYIHSSFHPLSFLYFSSSSSCILFYGWLNEFLFTG